MRPVISKRPRQPCFSDRAILPGGGRPPAPRPSRPRPVPERALSQAEREGAYGSAIRADLSLREDAELHC